MNRSIKIIVVSVLVITLLLVLLVMGFFSQGPSPKPIKKLEPYSLELVYPSKSRLDSNALEGQYYMVNFMASWCGHCIEEIVTINNLENEIPVTFIGIAISDSEDNLKEIFKHLKNPFDYIGMGSQFISYNFGNFSLPQTYIVNPKGEIIFKYAGVISKKQFEEQVIPFLKEITSKDD
jgi:cytochrome c biogenesis protein CcmG/thiol:disulfide interchange protein DsbE